MPQKDIMSKTGLKIYRSFRSNAKPAMASAADLSLHGLRHVLWFFFCFQQVVTKDEKTKGLDLSATTVTIDLGSQASLDKVGASQATESEDAAGIMTFLGADFCTTSFIHIWPVITKSCKTRRGKAQHWGIYSELNSNFRVLYALYAGMFNIFQWQTKWNSRSAKMLKLQNLKKAKQVRHLQRLQQLQQLQDQKKNPYPATSHREPHLATIPLPH